MELNLKETPVLEFVKDIEDDFSVIASGLNIHLIVTHDLQDCLVKSLTELSFTEYLKMYLEMQ